tara:strand:+ start:231 stop:656 length:426 start_codon:yes stop_codon:yes gene_type:complete
MFGEELTYYGVPIEKEMELKQYLLNLYGSIPEMLNHCSEKLTTILLWEFSKRWESKYENMFLLNPIHSNYRQPSREQRFRYLTEYFYQKAIFNQPLVSFIKPYKQRKFLNWLELSGLSNKQLDCLDLLAIFWCLQFWTLNL